MKAGWLARLESLGHGTFTPREALRSEPTRPADQSASAYLTGGLLDWIDRQDGPWFAHASYFRPHPPYAAAGHWSTRYAPADLAAPIPAGADLHPLHAAFLGLPACAAPADPAAMAQLRAQYFGMVSEVDDQIGRVVERLEAIAQYDETVIVVTSDHGEQLGDHGLVGKLGYFEQSYRVPFLVRDPGHPASAGRVVRECTEAVDLLPTVAELLGLDVPGQCDGTSLVPFLAGETPQRWRGAAHYEWDWRDQLIGPHRESGGPDPRLERRNLAVERTPTHAYVQFADGTWLCFDLAADPSWHTSVGDPGVVLPLAQSMLTWRSTHLGGPYTQMLLGSDRRGRWPTLGVG